MLTAWEEHPPEPGHPAWALGTSQKRALAMEGRPKGRLWGRHGVEWRLQLDNPGGRPHREYGAGSSSVSCGSARNTQPCRRSWNSPGTDLIAHSPLRSGNSLGTECKPEYSLPQCLLWLRQQMGLLKRCPGPSPLLLLCCARGSPIKTPPCAGRMGVTPLSVPPALRALIPRWLQAQACGASAGDAEQTCRSISMLRIVWRKRLTAPPVPGGKTLGRSLESQGC